MLFVTKNGVRKQVTQGMLPFIRIIDQTGGVPQRFWDDAQVLGYLVGCIRGLIGIVSGHKYKEGGSGEIIVAVLDDLAGKGRGLELAKQIPSFMASPEFREASASGLLGKR